MFSRTQETTGVSHQHCTCCSPRAFDPPSFNTPCPSQSSQSRSSFHTTQQGVLTLLLMLWPFPWAGSSSGGQGHVTGKWSAEQNVWQGLGWTGQSGVECWEGGCWKIPECHGWGQSYGRKKARETEKSRHPGRLLTIQMTPLRRPLSRRMSLPATPSIIVTPTAEQHLFISSDRWKRACEDGAGVDHQIRRPINYEELVQHRPDHGLPIMFPGSATCCLRARQYNRVTRVGNVRANQGVPFVCHTSFRSVVMCWRSLSLVKEWRTTKHSMLTWANEPLLATYRPIGWVQGKGMNAKDSFSSHWNTYVVK